MCPISYIVPSPASCMIAPQKLSKVIALHIGVELHESLISSLLDYRLAWASADHHSFYEFMSAKTMSYPEESI